MPQKSSSNEADQSTPTHHPCRQSPFLSMTKRPFSSLTTATFIIITATILSAVIPPPAHAFGFGSTLVVISASSTVCGVVSEQPWQPIICYRRGQTVTVEPNISFSTISGARTSLCGLRSGGYSLRC
ncbi:serine/threonine-protein kinase-like protein CCR3 [Pyrus ussuriensis x Pyrus communis]|uniref:Serine/threonine-protein kinase-like protein CCR3 n=1 Tax=Pyrus ussuriensis x Pyrus communis TaxID=2448454 RepID=A0A5N5GZZ2_9ROSA|nr:serine/threonine-protein kinase-like protein CCR3 [Pyrus ussuriensis x Pyrus communis]